MGQYSRTIPRDLFNESNLLKCYGQIYLELESGRFPAARLTFAAEERGESFDVRQNPANGALSLGNVLLFVRGECCSLERPLNSRDPFPLYLTTPADEEISVFTDAGRFTAEMRAFLARER